jgi:hypothetical protein
MTRKDYVKIVKILNEFTRDGNGPNTLFAHEKFNAMVEQFAEAFEEDNPRFSRDVFFSAVKRYNN